MLKISKFHKSFSLGLLVFSTIGVRIFANQKLLTSNQQKTKEIGNKNVFFYSQTSKLKASGLLGTIGSFFANRIFQTVPIFNNLAVAQGVGAFFSLITELPNIMYATKTKRYLYGLSQKQQHYRASKLKRAPIKKSKPFFVKVFETMI